jgi:uncharacterized membrane protein
VGLAAFSALVLASCTDHPTGPVLTAPRLSASQVALTFTTIDAPGASYTSASGINDARQTVGTFLDPSSLSHGFLLSGGTFTTIDVPSPFCSGPCPPFETEAGGINTAGQIVGAFDLGYWIFGYYFMHGFLRSGGKYTTIDVPGAFATQPSGVNDSGQVVGTFVDPPYLSEDWVSISGASHGFLLSRGAFTTIEPDGAFESGASGVNEARQIVGWFSDVVGTHGFLLAHGTFTTIDVPGATPGSTTAYGINAAAQIVGSFLDATGSHGFLLAAGTFTTIDVPGAIAGTTIAFGINATGQIVGSFVDAKNVVHGFVASP